MTTEFKAELERIITRAAGTSAGIISTSTAAGGSINEAATITTNAGKFFVKWNDESRFPAMFDVEAKGLELLAAVKAVDVPLPLCVSTFRGIQFLLLPHRENRIRGERFQEQLAAGLAGIHRTLAGEAGLAYDNYIGSLPQSNAPSSSWPEFVQTRRLEPQLVLAERNGVLPEGARRHFDELFERLPSILPRSPFSLLHGDLWSGNVISNHLGEPVLIDPAVYYGDREVDIAMTTLFGGFDAHFYDTYQEIFPLTAGYQERLRLYTLYPLLVHLNLFGSAYWRQIDAVLRRFL